MGWSNASTHPDRLADQPGGGLQERRRLAREGEEGGPGAGEEKEGEESVVARDRGVPSWIAPIQIG